MKTHAVLVTAICLLEAASVFAEMDDARLKERLTGGLFELLIWRNADIKAYGVTDEQFHRVLMDLYRDAEGNLQKLTPRTEEWNYNQRIEEGVLACLSMCGDVPVKDFLLEFAGDTSKDGFLRTIAISSYLRVADAGEARSVLARVLTETDRLDSQGRSSVLEHARTAYQEADAEKKAAIREALYAALAREDNKWLFRVYDGILVDMSKEYRESVQRLDILRRLIAAPSLCKADEIAMPELAAKLREVEKMRPSASISTSPPGLHATDADGRLHGRPTGGAGAKNGTSRPEGVPGTRNPESNAGWMGAWLLYAVVAASLTVAAGGVWLARRRRRASRARSRHGRRAECPERRPA